MAVQKKKLAPPTPEKHMPFLDHLEELRWHVVRAVIAVMAVAIGIFANIKWVMDQIILAPLSRDFITYRLICRVSPNMCPDAEPVVLQITTPTEAFSRALLISFVGGLIITFPYIIWEVWRFVKPGLAGVEVKKTRGIVLPITLLFFTGVSFGYMVITPFSFAFFQYFTLTDRAVLQWRIGPTVGLIVQIALAGGLLFQMPVAAWVLGRIGVLQPALMRKFRKHAIVVILIIAAILTPGADLFSQALLALPMLLLYEVSILVVGRVHRRRLKLQALAAAEAAKNTPPPGPDGNGGDDDDEFDTPPPAPRPPLPADYNVVPEEPIVILPPIHSLPQHGRD
jgi:sec-independent protein translocase protein TatC